MTEISAVRLGFGGRLDRSQGFFRFSSTLDAVAYFRISLTDFSVSADAVLTRMYGPAVRRKSGRLGFVTRCANCRISKMAPAPPDNLVPHVLMGLVRDENCFS